ncbi:MAG TPA: GNAT family N-acetyltransferase [Chitinophagaceae bacterium]|nr:GNAT family N-acetyltransferase [Chitinophagaceae bacterium]
MPDFIIQPLTNKDSEQVIHLVLPIQTEEFGVQVTLEGQPDLLDIETNYYKKGGGFWGAVNEHGLLGTIALLKVGHNAGVIRKMFVRKEWRGKEYGVGQALLDELLVYCRNSKITDLYLGTVEVFKAAQRFYERNGFTVIEKEKLPSYFPFMPADNKFYHIRLAI